MSRERGFALVVTLSLMVLLTIVAVGLLSLSAVSLRASVSSQDHATARANARLALMMALGELQKTAGPDQRVTARADILGANIANPRLTGVWQSWEIKATSPPSPGDYGKTARDNKFVGWLASCADGVAARQVNFGNSTLSSPVVLWGNGTLGGNATADDVVKAPTVPLSSRRGAIAWAVLDEGVKVRVNTPYTDGAVTAGAKTAQLGAGQRPNTASLKGLDPLQRHLFQYGSNGMAIIDKGITKLNFGLAVDDLFPGIGELLKPLHHDVTSSSVGIFTDTASGGLKEDFSLLANAAALPANYAGKGIYASRLGKIGPSDPTWESLHQFARIYQDAGRLGKDALSGTPYLKAQGPAGWKASTGSNPTSGEPGTIQPAPPPGVVLMPSVAKVQVVFSLLTRDIYKYPKVSDTTPKPPGTMAEELANQLHWNWAKNWAGSDYDYILRLLYTPVVTLHNPYNVALEFSDLRVVFGNLPFGLRVYRNGDLQTNTTDPVLNGFAPLDTMYLPNQNGGVSKRFGMTLKTNGGTTSNPSVGTTTFRMLPGEVMLFSPYIDPNRTYADEFSKGAIFNEMNNATLALNIDGLPGWRGDGIGFDLDYLCPTYFYLVKLNY